MPLLRRSIARQPASAVRSVLTPGAIARLILGWGGVLALAFGAPLLTGALPGPLLTALLTAIVVVVIICAFGVVEQAEHLAHRLGDPYGSLVLTLSIVLIEVILISAVMLGPGDHTTIARDSVMAVAMIILNLIIGLSLLVAGLRYGSLRANRAGASTYLAMLVVLSVFAFALPALVGEGGAYTRGQQWPIIVLTIVLYAFFLWRQMGVQADDFTEDDGREHDDREHDGRPVAWGADRGGTAIPGDPTPVPGGVRLAWQQHRTEILARTGLLVITVLPVVLLSHDMAALLDDGLARVGAPVALAGLVIAMIVFLPESLTSIRAALGNEIQRVSNLCHGAMVSTVGLTVPAVLVIGMLTGQRVVLAESATNLTLMGISLALTAVTFLSPRITALHGGAHLALFAVFVLAMFS